MNPDDSTHTAAATYPATLQALGRCQTYDHPVRAIVPVETHFAWVFLTDEHAYKLKKPIRAPGFDLLALENRHRSCMEEVRLNRRLAPDVYLGVVPLTRELDGTLRLNGRGEVVEWLVKMRRLPEASMLDRAIAAGTVTAAALDATGRLLADFYRAAEPVDFTPSAYAQRLALQIEADRRELASPDLAFPAARIEALADGQRRLLDRLAAEVALRAAERRIVEAHGDLRPEHIFLGDPPCIIDCLEFSYDLRVLDPAEELAYLGVECTAAGASWVGERLLEIYCALRCDAPPPALLGLYRSHRATVRAKVIAWHLRDPAYAARCDWGRESGRYLTIAEAALRSTDAFQ